MVPQLLPPLLMKQRVTMKQSPVKKKGRMVTFEEAGLLAGEAPAGAPRGPPKGPPPYWTPLERAMIQDIKVDAWRFQALGEQSVEIITGKCDGEKASTACTVPESKGTSLLSRMWLSHS